MIPITYDSTLIIGDTWAPAVVTVLDAEGQPADLTGAVGECQVRAAPGHELLLEASVSVLDAELGTLAWAGASEDTAGLEPGRARYAVRVTWPDGVVRTLVEGVLTIERGVVE